MNTFHRLITWIWRSWPIVIPAIFIIIHIYILKIFPGNVSEINKTVSLVAQITGGLSILYSIDSNIGIIKKLNLFDIIRNYLKEFPLLIKNVTLDIQGSMHAVTTSNADVTVGRNPQTIEEKIDYLQEQITDLQKDLKDKAKSLDDKIKKETEALKKQIQEIKNEVGKVKQQIEEVSIGGIKIQFFGVMLILYGSITGYAA